MNDSAETKPRVVAVSGASGLIGGRLVAALEERGCSIRRLVRDRPENPQEEILWNPKAGDVDSGPLSEVDAVVHLAGENIASGRWTKEKKQRIRDSRVEGTRLLAEALAGLERRPRAFLCASAIGFYGDRGDVVMDESSVAGDGFLPEVCEEWEEAAEPARAAGIRVANLRTGVVLSTRGGALAKMLTPFKFGLGGVIGSGKQYMSWIALDDEVAAIQHVLFDDSISGPVNLVAPSPVTNREFTKTLGSVLGRPTLFPMPGFVARTVFGQMADELLLASTRVEPARLKSSGFQFRYAELQPALRHLIQSGA